MFLENHGVRLDVAHLLHDRIVRFHLGFTLSPEEKCVPNALRKSIIDNALDNVVTHKGKVGMICYKDRAPHPPPLALTMFIYEARGGGQWSLSLV